MSLNCQSINAKFDEVQLFIDRINTSGSLGILCLQESWTDINEDTLYFGLNPSTPNFVNIINGELRNVSKWLSANRLSLNVNKTKVMFYFIRLAKW